MSAVTPAALNWWCCAGPSHMLTAAMAAEITGGCADALPAAAAAVVAAVFVCVPRGEVEQIVDAFPGQSIDFFGALRARVYDDKVGKGCVCVCVCFWGGGYLFLCTDPLSVCGALVSMSG
jgi:hypothetical protein